MCLLQVVVNNAVSKVDNLSRSGQAAGISEAQLANGALSNSQIDSSTPEQEHSKDLDQCPNAEVTPSSGAKQSVNLYDILVQLPESDLCNLCRILALEG